MKSSSIGWLLAALVASCTSDTASPTYSSKTTAPAPGPDIAAAAVPGGCLTFRSTAYAVFAGGTWSGSTHALIGNEVLVPAPGPLGGGDLTSRAIDRIIRGLPYRGAEWAQFNYADGSIYGEDSYSGQPGLVEGQWNYHAQGKITGGTGRYEDATGGYVSQGPFLMYPALDDPEGGVTLITTIGHICLK